MGSNEGVLWTAIGAGVGVGVGVGAGVPEGEEVNELGERAEPVPTTPPGLELELAPVLETWR